MKKRRTSKPAFAESPLGDLEKCPLLYLMYDCAHCATRGIFGGRLRCNCNDRHKYKALRVRLVNYTLEVFDSLGEAERFSRLAFLETRGVISNLARQVRYPLALNEVKLATYVSDFDYTYNHTRYAEDFKGRITSEFRLKAKLIQALYPEVNLVLTKRSKKSSFRKSYFKKSSPNA